MKIIRKKTFFFIFAVVLALAVAAAYFTTENKFVRIALAVSGVSAEAAITLHFFSIKYAVSNEYLEIKSGIFFRKTKKIPLDKIILISCFYIGKTAALTIIKTAGSTSVIFGEISCGHAL